MYQHGWMAAGSGGPAILFTHDSEDGQPEVTLALEDSRWVFIWLFSKGASREFAQDVVSALVSLQEFCREAPVVMAPIIARWGLRAWCLYPNATTVEDSRVLFRKLISPQLLERQYDGVAMSMQTVKQNVSGVLNIGFGELRSQTILSGLQMVPRVNEGILAQGLIADIDASIQTEPALNLEIPKKLLATLHEIAQEVTELGNEV